MTSTASEKAERISTNAVPSTMTNRPPGCVPTLRAPSPPIERLVLRLIDVTSNVRVWAATATIHEIHSTIRPIHLHMAALADHAGLAGLTVSRSAANGASLISIKENHCALFVGCNV